jgi:hypothetical protein
MDHPAIFSATLGLSHPWQITAVSFSKEGKRMDITIDFAHGCNFTCPTCGAEGKTCGAGKETWHHHDFFRYNAYLHARVPCIECACCGVITVERPWNRAGSKFALIM